MKYFVDLGCQGRLKFNDGNSTQAQSHAGIDNDLPNAKLQMFPTLSHGSPEGDGGELLSIELKDFFRELNGD
ncbi:MAG TPA: hypothetical protein VFX43_00850 [Chitinophagaceae bacterium]|nr:hypothetical protein [Chitinophagaceae bacterium]